MVFQALAMIFVLVSCEGENDANLRSIEGVNIKTKSSTESKVIFNTEETTVSTLNGSVTVSANTFDFPVKFDVKDTAENTLMITAIGKDSIVPSVNLELDVCLNLPADSVDGAKIKVSTLDASDSIEVEGVQTSDTICIKTKSIPGIFSVIFNEESMLDKVLTLNKKFKYGSLKMNYDANIMNESQIYFVEKSETPGIMVGGILDASGQEMDSWLSQDLEICWNLENRNITTMTFKDWNQNLSVFKGTLKGDAVCFTPNNLVGSFTLGAQEVTSLTTPKKASLSATPVISLEPVFQGDVVSVYTDEACETDPVVSSTATADGALSLSPRLSKVGSYQFYAKSVTSHGGVGICSRAYVNYTLLTDLSAPTGLTLISPTQSISSHLQPVIQVEGVEAEAVVGLYSDASCQNLIVSGVATSSTIQLTSSTLGDGQHVFYAKMSKADTPGNCSSMSLSYRVDTVKPVINQAVLNQNNSFTSSLDISFNFDVTDADQMYITENGECNSGGSWETYQTSKSVSLTTANASNTIYVKFRDEALNETLCVSDAIIHDSLAPATPTIEIAGGEFINDATPNLNLSAVDANEMYLTNTAGCLSDGVWESYAASKFDWSLAQTNSLATVYVKYRDEAGNETSCINDTVTHDNIDPSGESIVIDGGTHTADTTPDLILNAFTASEMYITNTAGCSAGGSWENYATSSTNWTLGQNNALAIVYVKYKDEAGNESSCVNDSITHDDIAPSSESIAIAGGTHTSDATPDLILSAVDANQMYVTNTSGCATGGSWEAYSSARSSWSLSQTNGTATVYIKFKDEADNETSCVSDTIVHDSVVPSAPGAFADGAFNLNSESTPVMSWSASSDATSGVAYYEVGVGTSLGATNTLTWQNVGLVTSISLTGLDLTEGLTYYATVRATDNAGNIGSASNGDGFIAKTVTTLHQSISSTFCGTFADNSLKCWGRNDNGQAGIGSGNNAGDNPSEMGNNLAFVDLGVGRSVLKASAATHSVCAILDNNTMKCWGTESSGQLGNESNIYSVGNSPGELGDALPAIQLGTGRTAQEVSSGLNFHCAILDNGAVKCWGQNNHGQLGVGSTNNIGDGVGEMGDSLAEVDLGTGRTATDIVTGYFFACAFLDNSDVKCWGYGPHGTNGQESNSNIGDGAGEMGNSLPAIDLGTGRTAVSIAAGGYNVCAILDNADLKCWGEGSGGNLGTADIEDVGDDSGEMGDGLGVVDLGTSRTASQISVGDYHICAILDNDDLKCWGRSSHGQLGKGNTDNLGDDASEMGDSLLAIDLGTGRHAIQVVAGTEANCALLDNNTLKCWGNNDHGKLGTGDGGVHKGDGASEMGDALPTTDL